jgi:hypothetical protein
MLGGSRYLGRLDIETLSIGPIAVFIFSQRDDVTKCTFLTGYTLLMQSYDI